MANKQFIYGLATVAGTIIGVGLFSLPYITSKVGFWVMLFYFFILASVMIAVALIYCEISLRTKGLHRLPGYAEKYLGPWGKRIAFITTSLGLMGAILAYLIIGGQFLNSFLGPVFGSSNLIYTLIFFSDGAFLIFFGIKSIAKTELLGLGLFFAVLLIIFLRGFSLIKIENLFNFDWMYGRNN